MPTYEYRCNKCGEHFELFQTFAEDPLKKHPGACGGRVLKVLSPAGIVFSGSGFYKTDSRSGSNGKRGRTSETSESSGSSTSTGSSGASESSGGPSSDTKKSDNTPSDGKKTENKKSA